MLFYLRSSIPCTCRQINFMFDVGNNIIIWPILLPECKIQIDIYIIHQSIFLLDIDLMYCLFLLIVDFPVYFTLYFSRNFFLKDGKGIICIVLFLRIWAPNLHSWMLRYFIWHFGILGLHFVIGIGFIIYFIDLHRFLLSIRFHQFLDRGACLAFKTARPIS